MVDIKAALIFEMLGRPPEHLKTTLTQFIDKLGKEDGLEITSKKLNEPKKVEKAEQELYSTFAEIEADFRNIEVLINVIFSYMPSHIEITSPTELNFKNFELNSTMNSLTSRLHRYDELVKALAIERDFLRKKLQETIPNTGEIKEEAKVKSNKKVKKKKKSKNKK